MQWIKVFTNIFANPKMQLLLKERDGDTFFRIWIQLLTLAGTSMQGGKIMMSENTPMTVEDLATITHKSNKKIQNILDKLIHFEMLICEDNIYKIKNWEKYQSADKYELVKEQNRERQKRFRENQKNENNVNVTLSNGTEENKKENNKLEESKKDFSKKKGYLNYDQRDYSNFDWDCLYANLGK
ncbi:MAG: phage replisome organizer N-terminal domain-containing protein [Clostridia bacterium]|nr:phage replisome organizer N-terminal domain-containing protein [Clostridia bacterium]